MNLGIPMLTAAYELMKSDPARFGHGSFLPEDDDLQNHLGFASEDWARALLVISAYTGRRRKVSDRWKYSGVNAQLPTPRFAHRDVVIRVIRQELEKGPAPRQARGGGGSDSAQTKKEAARAEKAARGANIEATAARLEGLIVEADRLGAQLEEESDPDEYEKLEARLADAREEIYGLMLSRGTKMHMADLTKEDREHIEKYLLELQGEKVVSEVAPIAFDDGKGKNTNVVADAMDLELPDDGGNEKAGEKTVEPGRENIAEHVREQLRPLREGDYLREMDQAKKRYRDIANMITTGNAFRYMSLKEAAAYLGIKVDDAVISRASTVQYFYKPHQILGKFHIHSPHPACQRREQGRVCTAWSTFGGNEISTSPPRQAPYRAT